MKYRIAVSDNKAFEPLYSRIDEISKIRDIEYVITDEAAAANLLKSGKADIALITPIGYASIFKSADLRILPAAALAANGYSELMNISFKQNLTSINKILFPKKSLIAETVCNIVLAERYEMEPQILFHNGKDHEDDTIDAYFSYYGEDKGDFTIDVTEDWQDTFNFPLPLAFWAVRNEEYDVEIIEIVNSLRDIETPIVEEVIEITDSQSYEPRNGQIYWHWSDDFEKSLEETLDLLYYRNIISDIIDVKVYGRDYDAGIEDEL